MRNITKLANRFEKLAGKGIALQRVGGLSPVKQVGNDSAPEKYGVYAFIYPYGDLFFLGSTNPEGIVPSDKSRLQQFQREGYKRFIHHGRIWTRIGSVVHSVEKNGWYLTDADTLADYIPKIIAKENKFLRKLWGPKNQPVGSIVGLSKDMFEVFVPQPTEEKFKKPKR